ncbi:hypothetical protein PHSY_005287 [Pseudozyma hubeiensis SY62]|uniref:Uncharacterized protein n=1 Tax=Pseudozyma hubeiensis (strain SY62) TaxID=1305764 RepID=R9PHW7_PSEHS|nr:hypothetical protein PHSY_005287 [Pseudozyma hubeiensis SY62]GAC97700.1 hypothetical protein PHSY_005287 [Pseudozyma hubeiensis SY62]
MEDPRIRGWDRQLHMRPVKTSDRVVAREQSQKTETKAASVTPCLSDLTLTVVQLTRQNQDCVLLASTRHRRQRRLRELRERQQTNRCPRKHTSTFSPDLHTRSVFVVGVERKPVIDSPDRSIVSLPFVNDHTPRIPSLRHTSHT